MIELIKNETRNFTKLNKMRKFLEKQDTVKHEEVVQFKDWNLTEDGLKIGKETFGMRDSGMSTLLRVFGMPNKFYYDKSPTDMLVRDVNRMKDEYTGDSEMLVFFQEDEVRAISKPSVCHADRTNSILDNIGLNKSHFINGAYSDLGMRVTTSKEEDTIKVTKEDEMQIGLDLIYSDVGHHSLSGSPHLLRLVCTNGLVVKEKSSFLSSFTMPPTFRSTEDDYLKSLNENVKTVNIDSDILRKTFKSMKENSINALNNGEIQMKKIRSAMGTAKFDEHEKLSLKVISDDEKERFVINTDLGLYKALDITTRLAKNYSQLGRRKLEILAGNLVTSSAMQFLN